MLHTYMLTISDQPTSGEIDEVNILDNEAGRPATTRAALKRKREE